MPTALRHIAEHVAESRAMLDLNHDWDGEGSPAYNEATWDRAAHLVVDSTTRFWRASRVLPPAPIITNGPDGGVDIVWRSGDRKLLINIPEEPKDVATFYGRDLEHDHYSLQGECVPSHHNEWLLVWLTK